MVRYRLFIKPSAVREIEAIAEKKQRQQSIVADEMCRVFVVATRPGSNRHILGSGERRGVQS
jgi:hypothetical protein